MISNKTKKIVQAIAGVLLVIAFLKITEPVKVYNRILETDLSLYLIGTSIFLLIYPVAGLRWKRMVPESANISFIESMKIIAISYSLNKILPFNSGDIARSKIMESYSDVKSHGEVIGLVALERVMDIIVLSTIAVLSLLNFISLDNPMWISMPIILLMILLYSIRKYEAFLEQLVDYLPSIVPERVKYFLEDVVEGFNSLEKYKMLEILGLTGLRWILNIAGFYVVLLSSGVSITLLQVAGLTTAMSLVAALPITPAGLGAVEISATGLLIAFGLTNVESGTVVVLLRSLGVVLIGAIGLIILLTNRIKLQELRN